MIFRLEGGSMKRVVIILITVFLLLINLQCITKAEQNSLICEGCISEEVVYDKLMQHTAMEILDEFIFLERNGEH